MKPLRLGTRGSALALAQSKLVAEKLKRLHEGLEVELITVVTTGDKDSGRAPRTEAAPPGGAADMGAVNIKASFVKEIEEALLRGEIDLAVHSAKDLPAELPDGLVLAAIPEREDPRDAFIGAGGRRLDDLPPGALVGTASVRRRIQLRLKRPDLRFTPIRGNVDTRLRKLSEGRADALVLAVAGLKRLGLGSIPHEPLPVDFMVPAPGQGALAVEARADGKEVLRLLEGLDDEGSRLAVGLERRFLRAMGGGCSMPLGALARLEPAGSGGDGGPAGLSLLVFWADADGRARTLTGRCGRRPEDLAALTEDLKGRLAA